MKEVKMEGGERAGVVLLRWTGEGRHGNGGLDEQILICIAFNYLGPCHC